jgi:hypothetical protein
MMNLESRPPISVGGEEALAARTALSTETSPALGFAGLFVEFAHAHFFLDSASLNQFAETADRFLRRFSIT